MIATALVTLALQAAPSGEALQEAARRGELETVRTLLDAGADVNAGNRYGATALFFASERGHLHIVELLVERGARVDIQDSFYQMSALTRGLFQGHKDVVLFLLNQGAPEADAVLAVGVRDDDVELARAALATGRVSREAYDEGVEGAASGSDVRKLLEATTPPEPDNEALELTEEALSVFVGEYQNDREGRKVAVELRDGGLALVDGTARALEPVGERTFALPESDGEVSFGGRGGMVEFLLVRRGEESTRFRPIEEAESREAAPEGTADVANVADAAVPTRGATVPWGSFRGPDRSGIADGQGVPTEWDAASGKNIAWKTPIPGFSVASPIISGGRVYVITAVSGAGDETFRTGLYGDVAPVEDVSEHRWVFYSLDAKDGRIVWERELHKGTPGTKRHTKSSQANATPVTDGKRIVNVLGSVGLVTCHDNDGRLLWTHDIGILNVGWFYDPDYQWGHSSSPILYENRVIIQADVHGEPFITALDLGTGEEVWRTAREAEITTFGTPTIFRTSRGDELVTNGTLVRGYDPETGELLWTLGPNSEIAIGSPVFEGDIVYVTAGYPPVRPIYAIRAGSRGDLALPDGVEKSEALAWSKNRGGTYIPTPVVYRGYLYTNANNGRLTVYDAGDGDIVYRHRIGGVGGSYSSSPIAADGRLFFTNEEGETFVVRAGAEYELLAKNSVDDTVLSTPAASGGLLVIRGLNHVYGISE